MRKISVLTVAILLSAYSDALFAQKKPKFDETKPYQIILTLAPEKCIITGEENNSVVVFDGEKTELRCELGKDKLNCNQKGKAPESYDAFFEDGVFISRSQSGNVYILGNLNKKRYSISSNHLIPEKVMLMTKHCSGIIK